MTDSIFTFALEIDGDICRAIVFGDINGIVDAGTFPDRDSALMWINANWPSATPASISDKEAEVYGPSAVEAYREWRET